MRLLESFIEAKTGNIADCEDTFFVNEHFACVIDGATNVSGKLIDGKTPGRFAAETIKTAIQKLKGTEEITEIIEKINAQYHKEYREIGLDESEMTHAFMRPSAAMAIFSKHNHQIWMIGDCQCFFSGELYQNVKRVDEVFEEARSIIMKGELMSGKTKKELLENDIGFDMIKPLIQKQYNFQNTSPDCRLSYGVINGHEIPLELIVTIDVPEDVQNIAMATDGYPKIFDTLEASEAYLKEVIRIDPLCIEENMGTKGINPENVSFDDRTFVKVAVD